MDALTSNSTPAFDPNITMTLTLSKLPAGQQDITSRLQVSAERLAADEDLTGSPLYEAAEYAVRQVTDQLYAEARRARAETKSLEEIIGGPVTPSSMAAVIGRLLAVPRDEC